ncbi:MAG TPA: L-histidine N(alpha)-methyltransferase [Candidatus Baltobacteraceae bacterium]|nr:L-histidine N(alpha)-methyltransferase [Candidatus Baltobacteraceae bacterium]
MPSFINVSIHESQFPENVRRDLRQSLRSQKINHKFHYDSVKQTQKWLTLHQIYSPSRNDENVRAIYDESFKIVVGKIKSKSVHVIGLGCGGGQKDTRLLKLLKTCGKEIFYTSCDVSSAMVLTARASALSVLPEKNCFPFVCDLATTENLSALFAQSLAPKASRLLTFFGMIPNFEPQEILSKLASLVQPKDFLLFSANLSPEKNYSGGMKRILPQYDNAPTKDWLMAFLLDLGIEKNGGELKFEIANSIFGLKRFVASFHFKRRQQIEIENKIFKFKSGEKIQLFFSYRYTSELTRKVLAKYKLKVCQQWIADSEEEGVFLCRKSA